MTHENHARLSWLAALFLALGARGCSGGTSTGGGGSDASTGDDARANRDGPKGESGPACDIPECLRPYNCRLSCGGPVISSSCCPCAPPSFDDICCGRDACSP
jgi:hypothetical protein